MRDPRDSGHGAGSYRRLRVWRAGIELVETVYRITVEFPDDERFGLTAQMRRAAVSIPCNIAEGNERSGPADRRRFVAMARASVAELETQAEIAVRLRFIGADTAEPIFAQTDSVGRMLVRLRASIER